MPVNLSFNPITKHATKVDSAPPTSLQQWCKATVVAAIGLNNLDKVNNLPIPSRLKGMIGHLSLADFLIDGESLSPESHMTGVYEAVCLLTNETVQLRVTGLVDDIQKDDPGYLTSFEEDGKCIVIESPTKTLAQLIQESKSHEKSLSETTVWRALKTLVQYITKEDLEPNVHLSTDCIKLCGSNLYIELATAQEMNEQSVTAVYEAPEVLSNNNPDFRAFVWSIACIVYEVLAREPAFYDPTGTNPFSVYMDITNAVIPTVPTNGSSELQALVRQGLVHDRDKRWSFEEMKKVIESH